MEDTGRIGRVLQPSARRVVFDERRAAAIRCEVPQAAEVDRAHLLMLAECGVVEAASAVRLMLEIESLRRDEFWPLLERRAPRGWYFLYEDYFIERLGENIGGILQTARSRNDLNATILRLRLRTPYARVLAVGLRLQAVLLARAQRFAHVVMPAYTHSQPAVPITYGHYLAGVATATARDLRAFADAGADLQQCPLGAGAGGGTSLPIDTARTARLLGFDRPVAHSGDAVASRDVVLRLLAAAGILGVTLSRCACDLLQWSTAEFSFLSWPDTLVGSSSMMPQKRNPFLLEHVIGRSASPLGAFVSSASAMRAAPFANSVAVGTEAVAHVWTALDDVATAATLLRLMIAGARPDVDSMKRRAEAGQTAATELATRLAATGKLSFRAAHRLVGRIAAAASPDESLASVAARMLPPDVRVHLHGLDSESVVRVTTAGGGPSPGSLRACLEGLRASWTAERHRRRSLVTTWREATRELDQSVESFLAASTSPALS